MRVAPTLKLSDADRTKLHLIASRPKSSQRDATRARIILACAQGKLNQEVAKELSVAERTVSKWRTRFSVEERVWRAW